MKAATRSAPSKNRSRSADGSGQCKRLELCDPLAPELLGDAWSGSAGSTEFTPSRYSFQSDSSRARKPSRKRGLQPTARRATGALSLVLRGDMPSAVPVSWGYALWLTRRGPSHSADCLVLGPLSWNGTSRHDRLGLRPTNEGTESLPHAPSPDARPLDAGYPPRPARELKETRELRWDRIGALNAE